MNCHDHPITPSTVRRRSTVRAAPCRLQRFTRGAPETTGAQALTNFVLLAILVAAAAGSPANADEPTRDRSSMRAARVAEELRQRGCDKPSEDAAVRACVDAALAAVYPAGFSNRPADTP